MRAISNKGWAEWASLIFCSLRTNCLEYKCRITSRFHIHLYIPLSFLFLKWLACEIALQRDWASRHNEYSGTVWGFLTIFIALLWDRLVDMKENGLTRKILTWNKQMSGPRSRNCAITTLWIVKKRFYFPICETSWFLSFIMDSSLWDCRTPQSFRRAGDSKINFLYKWHLLKSQESDNIWIGKVVWARTFYQLIALQLTVKTVWYWAGSSFQHTC